ncbi:MAG: flagellar biosynthetic protein FliO [Pseudohongiella sp.]|nr:flagellar biosynthetic protein FliO [Pseudohongiella sp.]MDP2127454.1 flagellar biosynthetic protein FliO [Pseudohongiella sp.]
MAETSLITRAAQGAEPAAGIVGSGASALGQTLLWLIVVVGLILALAWLAKRLGGVHFQNAAGMKVLSTLPVGSKEKIAVVQVGDKQFLIGIAPGRVSALHVFEEPVNGLSAMSKVPAANECDSDAEHSSLQSFQQILVSTLSRKKS